MWNQFIQATCLPSNCGCEFVNLSEWIRQPMNFWSSLIFVFLGFLLLTKTNTFYQKCWSVMCVILGLSSHLAHASFTQVAMSADFSSIINLMIYPIFIHFNLKRSKIFNISAVLVLYISIFFIMFELGKITKITLCLTIFSLVFYYHYVYLRERLKDSSFILSILLLLLGFIFFLLDEAKILCSPHSLFQLHALWHFSAGLSLYYYGRWIFQSGRL